MKHVSSFSTGLSSAITVERVFQKYNSKDCYIVFMDTTIEDEDNYRFAYDCYTRWRKLYGQSWQFIYLRVGKSPYQVADERQIIPNQKIAPCTFELKIEPFTQFLLDLSCGLPFGFSRQVFGSITTKTFAKAGEELRRIHDVAVYIGYDFTEIDRCDTTQKAYESFGWYVDFPLLWKPYEMRPYVQVSREDWHIEPPRSYLMGFTHANCLGSDDQGRGGCVKFGHGDRIRQLINFPDSYGATETWENKMRQHPTRRNYALLRDQSNGKVVSKTLEQLRSEYESKQPTLFQLDGRGGCVHCGVGELIAC